MEAQGRGMHARAVAFVPVKSIRGKETMVKRHEGIAGDFRDDGRAGNGIGEMIASADRLAGHGQRRRIIPIHQHQIRERGQRRYRVLHGLQGGLADVVGINHIGGHDADADEGMFKNDVIRERALPRREALGVIDSNTQLPTRRNDGRSDDRPGPGTSSSFIHARDHATRGRVTRHLRKRLELLALSRTRTPSVPGLTEQKIWLIHRCPRQQNASCRPWF